jgi:hypothetical protein
MVSFCVVVRRYVVYVVRRCARHYCVVSSRGRSASDVRDVMHVGLEEVS